MNRFNYMKNEFISDLKTHEHCHLRKKTKHNSVKCTFFFVLFFFRIFGVCVCVCVCVCVSTSARIQRSFETFTKVEEPFVKLLAMHNGS